MWSGMFWVHAETGAPVEQGHIAVEAVLLLLLLAMFVQRAYKPGHKFAEDLTEKVCCRPGELSAEWVRGAAVPVATLLCFDRSRGCVLFPSGPLKLLYTSL